ncbi:2504_t:CDS:2 [Diversispora eburnea]|uniref:2504_t:CDS:1 n=1 Tax=Diversispora eburnea TaxID=1213867 RepID=A0A9N8WMB5_9GLOM|nr:2504_t:CDS:2 [Diversispora eburnea]
MKNHKLPLNTRTCVFIDSSNPNLPNQVMKISSKPFIKVAFPPVINIRDLMTKQTENRRGPNAFIIYRKIFVETARADGYQLPMTVVSSMASQSWEQESEMVKDEYKRLAKEANEIRNEIFPKLPRRKKRERWNIVSFQQPDLQSSITTSSTQLKNSITTHDIQYDLDEGSSSSKTNDSNDSNISNDSNDNSPIIDEYYDLYIESTSHSSSINTESNEILDDLIYSEINSFITPQNIEKIESESPLQSNNGDLEECNSYLDMISESTDSWSKLLNDSLIISNAKDDNELNKDNNNININHQDYSLSSPEIMGNSTYDFLSELSDSEESTISINNIAQLSDVLGITYNSIYF